MINEINFMLFTFHYRQEVKQITNAGIISIIPVSFNLTGLATVMMGVTFLAFAGMGGEFTTKQVFTTLSLYSALRLSILVGIKSFFGLYEASVAIVRIQVSHSYFCNNVIVI